MVSNAATIDRSKSSCKREKSPTVTSTSCNNAMTHPAANCHSKRNHTYTMMASIDAKTAMMPVRLSSADTAGPTTSTRRCV